MATGINVFVPLKGVIFLNSIPGEWLCGSLKTGVCGLKYKRPVRSLVFIYISRKNRIAEPSGQNTLFILQ